MTHHTQGPKVEYLIAQYMEDVFRREVRNLGVFVRKQGVCSARFFGETEPGVIDGRRIKGFAAPDVYRQWIQYWRRIVATTNDPFTELLRYTNANYPVVQGGQIWDTGTDSTDDIAQFLYSALVAEEGFASAFDTVDGDVNAEETTAPRLNREVESTFRSLSIFATANEQLPLVRHPIVSRQEVRGTTTEPHRPQFSQRNGKLFVMETVDFTERTKDRARDHAGFVSFMFDDLRDALKADVVPIAIVRMSPGDENLAEVRYGLSMLVKNAAEVINWNDAAARTGFIEARRQVALSVN